MMRAKCTWGLAHSRHSIHRSRTLYYGTCSGSMERHEDVREESLRRMRAYYSLCTKRPKVMEVCDKCGYPWLSEEDGESGLHRMPAPPVGQAD